MARPRARPFRGIGTTTTYAEALTRRELALARGRFALPGAARCRRSPAPTRVGERPARHGPGPGPHACTEVTSCRTERVALASRRDFPSPWLGDHPCPPTRGSL